MMNKDMPTKLYASPEFPSGYRCSAKREVVGDVLYLKATDVRNAISRIPKEEFDYWTVLKTITKL